MSSSKKTSVLFVCLGNICRSPTADGVFQKLVNEAGLTESIEVDSAGTSSWHIGSPPDRRTIQAAKTRNYSLDHLRGRQVMTEDFAAFDYILAMDADNLHELETLKPVNYQGHLGLFLDFSTQQTYREVPDPYHGGESGFNLVLDLVEDACHGLLTHISKK
ncbi:low molecular weight protein-tyrosine-phosphatase [Agarilytica rhodophyticola]|uniref:low molecular weight protein-tyrosine-phosphatase n=1 Tax=Agarilytica rhodophyticola TaxID=1737490 RepID=UPI000B34107B|nr:low molecular weight protein-tyrosine-phosphatase [Agarilytica rhodophyticola]